MKRMLEYNEKETADIRARWLKVYGGDRLGGNTKAYLWHVFSGNRYSSVEGDQAVVEYEKQVACEFVILPNEGENAYVLDSRPVERPFADFYVFPPNLAWTMAFTHEVGWLGPYFARHADYISLAESNAAKIKKSEAIAHAKAQGWM
ncbi:MAG: hypothetical protein ACI9R3_003912 [Verrucomicrobiales bacterium]|jgi:hypothetical protein